jgi:hypothetical protein
VEFDRETHFLGPDNQDQAFPAGRYAVQVVGEGLALKSVSDQRAAPVLIRARPTTHREAVDAPEPVNVNAGENRHAVLVLLPDGKGLQAIGAYEKTSGVELQLGTSEPLTFALIPRIIGIFTVPQLAAVSPGGTLFIKGTHFGASPGKVIVHLGLPALQSIEFSVESWTDTNIKATMPIGISGVPDHLAILQVQTSAGGGSSGWQVPFYATRSTKTLSSNDPVVKILHCSTGGDKNKCIHLDTSTGGSCFSTGILPITLTGTLYAQHVNCDSIVDVDDGSDRFNVTLKNGWVFKTVEYLESMSSTSEEINGPDLAALRHNLPGTSSWEPEIQWTVSPGPDQLEYVYWLTIEGPRGVLHY